MGPVLPPPPLEPWQHQASGRDVPTAPYLCGIAVNRKSSSGADIDNPSLALKNGQDSSHEFNVREPLEILFFALLNIKLAVWREQSQWRGQLAPPPEARPSWAPTSAQMELFISIGWLLRRLSFYRASSWWLAQRVTGIPGGCFLSELISSKSPRDIVGSFCWTVVHSS